VESELSVDDEDEENGEAEEVEDEEVDEEDEENFLKLDIFARLFPACIVREENPFLRSVSINSEALSSRWLMRKKDRRGD
jgi:hypothetical protein